MIIVRILGGLGNQMFQYAYAKALQQKGFDVKIDVSKFKKYKLHGGYHLNNYKIDIETANSFSSFLGKIGFKKTIKEKNLLYNENLLKLQGNEYVKGYFQTEKYFQDIRVILLQQFTPNFELSKTTKEIENAIKNKTVTCSLHVRRGDYISDKSANNVHGTCNIDYYKKAINYISSKYKEVFFYVFSDDINWVKKNLKIDNVCFVDHKCLPHEDMYLMSLCTHNITANSSFSWWGAWLNNNKNKTVVAPKKWFVQKENEVACQNWIKI